MESSPRMEPPRVLWCVAARVLLRLEQEPGQLLTAAIDAAIHGALGQPQALGHLLIAEALQIPEHDGLTELLRKAVETAPQEAAPVAILEAALRVAARRGRGLVEGQEVVHQHLLLPLAGPIAVDAVVPGHAAEPGGEVGVAMELVEAAEDLQEDLLREILCLVVLAGELVGDVEDLTPVARQDLVPRRVFLPKAALDELAIGRGSQPIAQGPRSAWSRRPTREYRDSNRVRPS